MDHLVQSGKKARSALVVGLTVCFLVWLFGGAELFERCVGEETADRFGVVMDELGAAARLVLLAAVAGAIGAVLVNLVLEPIVRWRTDRPSQVPWEHYQSAALREVRRYAEHYLPTDSDGNWPRYRSMLDRHAQRVPSHEYERHLMKEYESRAEEQHEVEFRFYLNLSLSLVLVAVVIHSGPGALPVGVLILGASLYDARQITARIWRTMRDSEVERIGRAVESASERVNDVRGRLAMFDKGQGPGKATRGQLAADLAELEEERAHLQAKLDGLEAATGRRLAVAVRSSLSA